MCPSTSMIQSPAACDRCRERKVKCDKLKPCSHCRRRNVPCLVSHDCARPRGHLGGRCGNRNSIQVRLARVEELLASLGKPDDVQQLPTPEASRGLQSSEHEIGNGADRLHRYVAGPVWSQLSQQIQGLRDILLSDADEENREVIGANSDTAPKLPVNMLLCGDPDRFGSFTGLCEHPPPALRQQLLTTFFKNVDPIFKVFHRPTVIAQLSKLDHAGYNTSESTVMHAMFFAIYAAATRTIPEQERVSVLGLTRNDDLQCFVAATERLLSQADYLNSKDLRSFQAFIIYLLVVRAQDSGQKHWALLGLAVQLARGFGLHSIATTNTSKPLERELRLRAWQVLRNLDFRAALDRGVDPIIRAGSYDTPLPTNLNDIDLTDEMIHLPQPRIGITDSSFGVTLDLGIKLAARLQYEGVEQLDSSSNDVWSHRLQLVQQFDESINAQWLTHCQMDVPIQWTIVYTAHAISRLCHLLAVRPMTRIEASKHLPLPMSSHEVLDLALQSLRAEELFYQTEFVRGYWWCTWNHWYVLAVALVEICAVPSLCQDDDTWAVIQQSYSRQSTSIADSADGQLWSPMTKLMTSVRNMRAQSTKIPGSENAGLLAAHPGSDRIYDSNSVLLQSPTRSSVTDALATNVHSIHYSNVSQESSYEFAGMNDSMLLWDEFLSGMTEFSTY